MRCQWSLGMEVTLVQRLANVIGSHLPLSRARTDSEEQYSLVSKVCSDQSNREITFMRRSSGLVSVQSWKVIWRFIHKAHR